VTAEEQVIQDLVAKFPFLQGKTRIQRARRMWVETPPESFAEVLAYLSRDTGFSILCTITGIDQGATLAALYHLARESGAVLTLSTAVPRDKPVIRTVTAQFPSADAYERELVDLLGFQVEGLAPGKRYPLPDGWPEGQHPLRKDWKPEDGAAVLPNV
jgi:Ni,Fe-hydrogenase III component G